jgi:hypothetical protein
MTEQLPNCLLNYLTRTSVDILGPVQDVLKRCKWFIHHVSQLVADVCSPACLAEHGDSSKPSAFLG